MRVAFIVNHISLRNDIRLLILHLHKKLELVVFGSEEDLLLLPDYLNKCFLKPEKRTLYRKFLDNLYKFFGNSPKPIDTYKNYLFRLHHKRIPNLGFKKLIDYLRVQFLLLAPELFDYGRYLQFLRSDSSYILQDIDIVLTLTPASHEDIVAEAVRQSIPVYIYVHSWDHAQKFHRFSKHSIHYLCWNFNIKADLVKFHKIDPNNIEITGASQFYFIHNYLNEPKASASNKLLRYAYYVSSFGYPKLVKQEIVLIKFLCQALEDFDIKLVFRPYPNLENWDIYDELRSEENLQFDEFRRNAKFTFTEQDLYYKLLMIENALALFHCGTTIGLEASYLDTPIIYLNIGDLDYGESVKNFNHISLAWEQYHLKKYFYKSEFVNVVTKKLDLKPVLSLIENVEMDLLAYNQNIRSLTSLASMDEIARNIIDSMQVNMNMNYRYERTSCGVFLNVK